MTHQPIQSSRVLWKLILLCAVFVGAWPVRAQKPDSTQADSIRHTSFGTGRVSVNVRHPRRTIDLALTGGAGYYFQGDAPSFQSLANADFFAQTSDIDLTAGFHWGFSNPSTKALAIGLRFPLTGASDESFGFFADAALLFTDNPADSLEFSTGIRAALAARVAPFEFRIAGEIRQFPFDGDRTEAWVGIEAGFFINLLREEVSEPTRKDSLRAALRYIATSAELEDLDYAQSNQDIDLWFDKFWRARNVTHSPRNDEQEEYMRRVSLANQRYGTPRTMGVSTDMGRVILLYGEPDHLETAQAISILNIPRRFELWVYQDRVRGFRTGMFLFVKSEQEQARGESGGHGDYRQIYSNLPGEYSEGIPDDLPQTMVSYIEGFK